PITRPLRHQPRRHDVAGDPAPDQMTVQAEAGRASLVTTTHLTPTPQRPLDHLMVIRQRPLIEQLVTADRSQTDRTRVHVKADRYRHTLAHGRRPPYVALPGTPRQPTTNA